MLLAVLVAAMALAWMLLLPGYVTARLRERTGFDVKVASLSCNAFTGRVIVRGLVLGNPASFPVGDFVELREFSLAVDVTSLVAERLVVDELTADVRRVTLVRRPDGKSNADVFQRNLLRETRTEGAPGAVESGGTEQAGKADQARPRAFLIRRLVLRCDELVHADHSGAKPVVETFRLGLDQRYENVTGTKQLLVPDVLRRLVAANLSPALAALVPGDMGRALGDAAREAAGRGTELFKEASGRGADLLQGLREKLEESKKP